MKRIFCAAVFLISVSSFAQTKSIEFTKRLTYKIETSSENPYEQSDYEKVTYDYYIGKNNKEGLLSFYYSEPAEVYYSGESNFFVKNNWMIPVTVSGISKATSYAVYSAFAVTNENKVISKIDRKGNINGTSCQYYAVLSDPQDKENYEFCFCIDENSKTNNAEALFPDAKIKGLILAVEPKENDYRLVYKSSENASLKLDLDADKMIADAEEHKKEQEATYNAVDFAEAVDSAAYAYPNSTEMYNDPLYTYGDTSFENYELYSYLNPVYGITSTVLYKAKEYSDEGTVSRDQIVKLYKNLSKNLVKSLSSSKLITKEEKKELNDYFKTRIKEAEKFKPNAIETAVTDYSDYDYAAIDAASAAAAYVDDYDYYTKYESKYKNTESSEVSLAYDLLGDSEIKQNAPKYCEDLIKSIPNFQNKDLKYHVHNLTGQICDLYLYNNGGSVDYFVTIDEMRKSMLEIEKLRSSLSQKDQKSLLEFLKSLD